MEDNKPDTSEAAYLVDKLAGRLWWLPILENQEEHGYCYEETYEEWVNRMKEPNDQK